MVEWKIKKENVIKKHTWINATKCKQDIRKRMRMLKQTNKNSGSMHIICNLLKNWNCKLGISLFKLEVGGKEMKVTGEDYFFTSLKLKGRRERRLQSG